MMRSRYDSDDDQSSGSGNFHHNNLNMYTSSFEKSSQDIFFTTRIAKKSVTEVCNRQRFQSTLRQLEETCETNRSSWNKKDLVEQPFSDTGPDCWSTFAPDCLLSSQILNTSLFLLKELMKKWTY